VTTLTGTDPLPVATKARLAGEVVVTYVSARRTLRRSGLTATLSMLRGSGRRRAPIEGDPVAGGRRLGRVVSRTLSALPADARCLSQSLVLTQMLARRGVESRLVIAVKPGEVLAAHAWVEHDGVPLLPPGSGGFSELVTL
jgi:hypothetical protein